MLSTEAALAPGTEPTYRSRARHSLTVLLPLVGVLAALFFLVSPARAEGSKELTAQGGDRAFLMHRTSGAFSQIGGIAADSAVRVYVQPGERILLGSSAAGIGNGTINYTRPDGTTGTCGSSGVISDRSEEVAGPSPAAGGYTPCSITVGVTEGGVWLIHFVSPNSTSTANSAPQAASAVWTQSNNVSWIAAWDVTVRNAADTATIPGRVYTNYLALDMGSNGRSFDPEMFVKTRDGFMFRYDYNGIDPFIFLSFVNNKGFRDSSSNSLFRSVQLDSSDQFQNGESVHNPGSADTAADVTHKMFFNTPAGDLPAMTSIAGGTTWLDNPPAQPPTVSDVTFTGSEGTPNQAGVGQGGTFWFDTDANSTYRLVMDISGDGTFGNANDRILFGNTASGQAQIVWDGRDGNSNVVGATASGIAARVTVYAGEVHFPLLDPENNPVGTIIERLVPSSNFTVYYNDEGLAGGTPPVPVKVLNGESSQTGAHEWSGSFGNHKGIDTWVFGNEGTVVLNNAIEIKSADLAVSVTDNQTNTASGQPITYTVTVTNGGPSDITGAAVDDPIPSGISGTSWTCQITTGIGACGAASGTGNLATTVDLDANAVATFTVTGTVAPDAPAVLSNTATVTRPNDVDDPATSNNSATDTTNVNRAPTAEDKTHSTNEDETLSVSAPGLLADASDTDGDTLTAEEVTGPGNGTLTVNGDGSFTYVPDADFNGSATFTYRVCDNGTPAACSAPMTVTITVNAVNDSPSAQDDAKATDEDQPLTFPASDLTGNDSPGPANESGQTLTVTSVGSASNGGVSLAGGQITFTPTAGYVGPASFVYTVSDGPGGADTATVAVTVNPVNDPPTISNIPDQTTDEGTTIGPIRFTIGDAESPAGLVVTAASSDQQLVPDANIILGASAAGRTITIVPAADQFGQVTITITVTDPDGASTTETFVLTVTPVNDVPTIDLGGSGTGYSGSFQEDGGPVPAVDPDALVVDDIDNGDLLSATITLVNRPDGTDEVLAVDVTGTSITPSYDPQTGVLTLTGPATLAEFQQVLSTVTYNNSSQDPATADRVIEFVINDGSDESSTATATISVAGVNDAPAADDDDYSIDEDQSLTVDPAGVLGNDADPEGDNLSATLDQAPQFGTLILNANGSFEYLPIADFNGTDTSTYTVSDGNGGSDAATVTITVGPANDAPVASDDDYQIAAGKSLAADGQGSNPPGVVDNDGDIDGDNLTIADTDPNVSGVQPISGPSNGALVLSPDGTFDYAPRAGFAGPDTFTYEVCDPDGLCDTATVTVEVVEASGGGDGGGGGTPGGGNSAPVVNDDYGSTGEAAAVSNAYVSQYRSKAARKPTRVYRINSAQRPYNFVKLDEDVTRPLNALGYRSTDHNLYGYRLRGAQGIMKIDSTTGASTFLGNPRGLPESDRYLAGDVSPDGSFYYLYANRSGVLWRIDLQAFRATRVKLESTVGLLDFAVNPADGNLYGVSSKGKLCRVDPATGDVTSIKVARLRAGTYGAVWFTFEGDLIAFENGSAKEHGTLNWIADPASTPTIVSKQAGPSTHGNDGAAYVAEPDPAGLSVVVDVLANDMDPNGDLDPSTIQIVDPPAHGTAVVNADGTITYTTDGTYSGTDSFQYEVCDKGTPPECGTATVYITAAPVPPGAP